MAETIPPLSAADVATDLNNSTFAVYLYIGNETDVGWDNAKVAFRLVPRLRIYLVKDSTTKCFVSSIGRRRMTLGSCLKPLATQWTNENTIS